MTKIQDLINIGQYEISNKAGETLTYVVDEYEPENLVSMAEIKTKIKDNVKYIIEHDYQAYEYLRFHPRDCGNFEEAIKSGEMTAVGIARFYLIKELFEKLEEIKND